MEVFRRLGMPLLFAAALLWLVPAQADVQYDPRPITWANCSLGGAAGGASQIAVGGTAVTVPQGAVPPGPALRGIFIQNPSTATESLFVDVTATTASTTAGVSIELTAGQTFSEGPGTIGNTKITVNATTAGHKFVCKYGL